MIQPLLQARAKKCTKLCWFFGAFEIYWPLIGPVHKKMLALYYQNNPIFTWLTWIWIQNTNEFNNCVIRSKNGERSISDNFKKGEMPVCLTNHVHLIIFEKNSHHRHLHTWQLCHHFFLLTSGQHEAGTWNPNYIPRGGFWPRASHLS